MVVKARHMLKMTVKPIVTILFTLLIGAALIWNSGESPIEAYGLLFSGAFGSVTGLMNTLAKATPLIFTGLAASLASIAGVFNIGVEGQLYLGAFAAAIAGSRLSGLPSVIREKCAACAFDFKYDCRSGWSRAGYGKSWKILCQFFQ